MEFDNFVAMYPFLMVSSYYSKNSKTGWNKIIFENMKTQRLGTDIRELIIPPSESYKYKMSNNGVISISQTDNYKNPRPWHIRPGKSGGGIYLGHGSGHGVLTGLQVRDFTFELE